MGETHYSAAIAITDAALAQPVGSDVKGVPTATGIDHVLIDSAADQRNGIIIAGKAAKVGISHVLVHLTGMGKNDFLGIGAGIMVRDHATADIDHVKVETNGAAVPALVSAEGATTRISNTWLAANGGPLPAGYVRHIGPGMMEPPPPLGLQGDARTLLAMSNSHTVITHSHIEADGWGALSTDATGGDLTLEADDCEIVVNKIGYGTYADFGAHVMIRHSRVESGGDVGIIAGKARIDLSEITGHAGRNGVTIHSVMAFDPAEAAELTIANSNFVSAGPVVLVKSANAVITLSGAVPTSASGVLLEVRKNDDPNATKTGGKPVPGVTLRLNGAKATGDVVSSDPDRGTQVALAGANLSGALTGVTLSADAGSHWTARADSSVVLADAATLGAIDAPAGVTVNAQGRGLAAGARALPGGGRLVIRP